MSTYPTYRSPIRLLDELGVDLDDLSPENLKLERKRLLLEVQLSEKQILERENQSFSKNDIIRMFDELKNTTTLAHHCLIYSNKSLLYLLENASLDVLPVESDLKKFEVYDEHSDFASFVSPYIANAYDRVLSGVIRDSSYDQFLTILPFSNLLLFQDAIFAFRKFWAYCEFLWERLDKTHYVKELFPFEEFTFLYEEAFYSVANKVNQYYEDTGDMIATVLINFTIDQNWSSGRSNYLYKIYYHMQKLDCSKELKSEIYSKIGPFRRDTLWQITKAFGIGKRYLIILSFPVVVLILGLIFGDLTVPVRKHPEQEKAEQKRALTEDKMDPFEELREMNRIQVATIQQRKILPYSYIRRAEFDTTAFRIFQDSFVYQVESWELAPNLMKLEQTPQLISPFIVPDSTIVDHFGGKSVLKNKTDSEFLMIIIDQNALYSYYIPAYHGTFFYIDPNSSVFFYAGNNWNHERSLTYTHPFKSAMSDSILITTNGSFDNVSEEGLEFMRKTFHFGSATSMNLIIGEQDGQYFIKRTRNKRTMFADI